MSQIWINCKYITLFTSEHCKTYFNWIVFLFYFSQSSSNCVFYGKAFVSKRLKMINASKTILQTKKKRWNFRNPTRKGCGCTLNTREHKNGNFDVHRCVCCMQRMPHLGQPTVLDRRMCFQKRQTRVKYRRCQSVLWWSSSFPSCLSCNCHYCWWYEVEMRR